MVSALPFVYKSCILSPAEAGIDCLLLTLPLHCEGERDCCSTGESVCSGGRRIIFFGWSRGGSGSVAESIPFMSHNKRNSLRVRGVQRPLVSGGFFCPLFQLLGKVGCRRHVPYANVLLKESRPPEAIEEKLLGKYAAGGKRRKDCGKGHHRGSEAQNSAKKD